MELVTKTEVTTISTPHPIEFTHWRYDRNDLESIKLEPSRRIIRIVADTYVPKDVDWDARLDGAFNRYKRYAASISPWWKPKLDGKWDEFRWNLHFKLLKWGVIV